MGVIRYYLQPNPVTPDPNDQIARIQPSGTIGATELIKLMNKRGTSLTKGDMEACITLMSEVVTDAVADGYMVNLPFCNIRPSIKGVFASPADSYDHTRHIKRASLSAGLLLAKKLGEARVEKTSRALPSPDIQAYEDVNSKSYNSILTPGGIGKLEGSELKFSTQVETDGVFLISATGDAIRATVYAMVTEGKVMFMVPSELAPGEYTLELRRNYTLNNNMRAGHLQDTLTVAGAGA